MWIHRIGVSEIYTACVPEFRESFLSNWRTRTGKVNVLDKITLSGDLQLYALSWHQWRNKRPCSYYRSSVLKRVITLTWLCSWKRRHPNFTYSVIRAINWLYIFQRFSIAPTPTSKHRDIPFEWRWQQTWHRCSSEVEDIVLFRIKKWSLIDYTSNSFGNFNSWYCISTLHTPIFWQNLLYLFEFVYSSLMITL